KKKTLYDQNHVLKQYNPLVTRKHRDICIRLRNVQPEVVQLGNGVTEADLLVHDETNPALAYLIARLGPPHFPTPIGVFSAVERPCYDDTLNQQVTAARAKTPPDLRALVNRGDACTVA